MDSERGDDWAGFATLADGYPFCAGSLYQEYTGEGRLKCRACDYSHAIAGYTQGMVPNHDPVGKKRTHAGQQLGKGRQRALWALLACPRSAYPVGVVLTELCLALGLRLEPNECFHPKADPGGRCDDCYNYQPDDEGDCDDIPF